MVQKILINIQYWTVTIMDSKCYVMCVLHLHIMEQKSLQANISYFITEYFCVLTCLKFVIEDYLKYKCLYCLTKTNNK